VTPGGGELRRNPASGRLSIVAPARASRPADASGPGARAGAGAPPCPFCAGNEGLTPPEVDAVRPGGGAPDGPGWRVRVVPNKYPALDGRHEVIVHAPAHEAELEDLGDDALAEVLAMWQRRITAHLESGAAAVTLIGNLGAGSGASLEHPHEQLFATPVVPPLLLDELVQAERHRNRYGTCVVCDEIEKAGDRTVLDGAVAAWVPDASRFNGELWLAPAAHEADFRAADPAAVAPALRRALTAVKASIAGAPLNFWLHTAPADVRGPFHWHLELAPRTSALAGFELGTDIALVIKSPAEAAREYRAALPPA
jgi:UDPglucose--hexose-1-phosphate uridylyltransferase